MRLSKFGGKIKMVYYENNELYHYGILGQKWGIRRYQNFDGSYTREGLRRYNKSLKEYENARDLHKTAKKMYKASKTGGGVELNGQSVIVTKDAVKDSKRNLKAKKRQLNKDYQQLKKDKAGDIGKELYRSGKTITGNAQRLQTASYIAAGTAVASGYLRQNGNTKLSNQVAMIGIGMEAVNALFGVKNAVEAHYLRAYYGHSRK